MSANDTTIRDIAGLLVPPAARKRSDPSSTLSASIDRLRPGLLTIMGQGGVRVLVARALYLSGDRHTALRNVTMQNNGTFSGLGEASANLTDADFREAHVSFLGEVLNLLLRFLGPGGTMVILRDAWPDIPLGHVEFRQAEFRQAGKS